MSFQSGIMGKKGKKGDVPLRILKAAAELLPFEGKSDQHYRQPERFLKIAYHIKEARRAEELGLSQLGRILLAI